MAKTTVSRQNTYSFSQVAQANIPRSKFNRSHGLKTTFDSGKLIPIFLDEVIPGDTHNLSTSSLVRLSTPLHPIMDNIYLDYHFFFVPYRLVWENFQKFMGEQKNPGDSIDYVIPTITAPAEGYQVGSLEDYFGLPTNIGNFKHNSLYHRAYNLIWNEWYRDENLQDEAYFETAHFEDPNWYKLLRRGKRHDYFTSCLPFPQKGNEVTFNLGDTASVVSTNNDILFQSTGRAFDTPMSVGLWGGNRFVTEGSSSADVGNLRFGSQTGLQADLSSATGISINALREACALQRFLERDARGGTRYTELVRSHYGVTSSDARLQRPEYLGGGSHPLSVNPVPQTSSSDTSSPQGNLGAYGVASGSNIGFTKSFEEHGMIIGLVSARADMTYQQGLDKMWSRETRYDILFPEFAHLGEQAVLNKEIFCQGDASDEEVFGYQERYAEYRYKRSMITGLMRSSYTGDTHQSLDTWHLSQQFADSTGNRQRPHLNEDFIEERPPIKRAVAVQDEPEFIGDFYFNYSSARTLPTYSIPSLVPRL